jgi:photosystem II stability/assembly factor-like uncharacterized protein
MLILRRRIPALLCALLTSAIFLAFAGGARADVPSPAPSPKAPSPSPSPSAKPSPTPKPGPAFANMQWREIGPAAAGGRVAAVAGSANDPKLYYVGSAGGGVWKTANGGLTWDPVFADQKVAAIGAVEIDPTNNDIVWVGTGEANPRNDVSYGNGVYKSTDGGKSWTDVGLKDTRHISRILIDPRDSNHVVVGALGDVFADSTARGVYVTWDGGKTWDKTLYIGPQSGPSDLAMSSQNPNVMYAGMWQFRRVPWNFTSGGPDDGLYKSIDGGKTWTKLVGHGLPAGTTGRIGLAVAPSDDKRVYAIIEAKEGILWRSDDGGANWTMVSDDTIVDQRPFYFTHIAVDPKKPDRVYAVSFQLALSTNGGKKFRPIAQTVHVDYHAIWIAPNDPGRIIVGEDGGYAVTVDAGANWFFSANLPIGQIYHVGLSNENPYNLCVGLQDNNGWCGPSNSLDPSGIQNKHWIVSTGGDGEWGVPDPSDPNYIWSDSENGSLSVYNKVTQDAWTAAPFFQTASESYDLSTSKYRFNWDSPIAFDPFNGHVAWYGGNVVFQSTDRGISWKPLSPDLTLNLKSHQQPTGGPMVHDVSGAEYSDTILDIEGSTLRKGEIWVGTDDGLVQLSRDGGKHWKNVSPPGVPPFGRVETIAPSNIDAGTAYVNIDRHRSGDYKPYVFMTHDFGKTWASIVTGLPADQYVRTIRPDIHNRSLVYAGTEEGVWISQDGAKTWQSFQNELPTASVRDIRIQPQFDDLVIATHGRSAYIMDDIRPLQDLQSAMNRAAFLFQPRTAFEYNLHGNDEGTYTNYVAENPPYGVILSYYLREPQKAAPKLEILDSRGHAIRTISGTHKVGGKDEPYLDNKVGINRYVWDFQVDGPVKWSGTKEEFQGPGEGPGVPPGRYGARLTVDGHLVYIVHFDVKSDPRTIITQAQFDAAYQFAVKYFGVFSNIDTMLNGLDDVKKNLDAASVDAKKKNLTDLQTKIDAALAARTKLFDTLTANFQNGEDSIQRPGALREDLFGIGFTGAPLTPPILEFAKRIDPRYDAAVASYNDYVTNGLKDVKAALKAANMKALPDVKILKG